MVNIDILNVKTKELVFHALPQIVIMLLYTMGLNRQTHHMYGVDHPQSSQKKGGHTSYILFFS